MVLKDDHVSLLAENKQKKFAFSSIFMFNIVLVRNAALKQWSQMMDSKSQNALPALELIRFELWDDYRERWTRES